MMKPNASDWSTYLQGKPWTMFATFTTAKPISLGSARRLMEKVAGRVLRSGELLFWAAEKFEMGREGFHLHCLINTRHSPKQVEEWYSAHYGRCDCRRFNPSLGAAFYCCKYLTKAIHDYDVLTGQGEDELFAIGGKVRKAATH